MHSQRFFDQTLDMINRGGLNAALPMLAGKLYNAHANPETWPETRAALHSHALHSLLLQDPFTAHSASRPRGYPGDAGLIDLIYDMTPPGGVSDLGREIFGVTIQFQAPEGWAHSRLHPQGRTALSARRCCGPLPICQPPGRRNVGEQRQYLEVGAEEADTVILRSRDHAGK